MPAQGPPVSFRDKQIEEWLRKHTALGESLGMVAQRALDRYMHLCINDRPHFRTGEWYAIFDALNGCCFFDAWSPRYVFAEVADAIELGQKWKIDQDALVQKLRALTYGQCVAVVDAAEQFWSAEDYHGGGQTLYDVLATVVGEKYIIKEDV